MKDINNKKINIYIGLTTNQNKPLNLKDTLKIISNLFIKNGITGFNINRIMGYWNKTQEKALIVSFINTYNLKYSLLKEIIIKLRDDLKQDAVLLEVLNIPFEFI